jgi:DNA-binding MarR family transcriptional regulator
MVTAERTDMRVSQFKELREAYRRADRTVSTALMREIGITPAQALALLELHRAGGRLKAHALALTLAVAAQSCTSLIDALAEKGYVTRRHDTKDRRVVWVELTPTGETAERLVADALIRACKEI